MVDEVGDVKIFDRVLSPTEIQRTYKAAKWRYGIGEVLFYRHLFGWYILFERKMPKGRIEYSLRIWRKR